MEDFTPEKLYHPEDEYASLDGATEQLTPAPAPEPAQETAELAQQPAPQPYAQQPVPQQPVYPAYPQQPVQSPVQQPVPQQPAPYPYPNNNYPPQQAYPQQPQQAYPPQQPYPPQAYPQQQPQQAFPQQQPYRQAPAQQTPSQTQNPYAAPYNPQPAQQAFTQQKPPTPTGTKVFIIVLCALLAAMVIGFVVYIAASNKNSNLQNNNSGFSIDNGDNKGDNNGGSNDPFGSYNAIGSGSYTEISSEITLKADNGETQKRSDDNKDSFGEPDKNAKNIVLNPLPADKDNEKYTTQSAYDSVSDSVVTVNCYQDKITDNESDIVTQGTGTIITADGYIITNAHVLGNSRMYAVNIILNNKEKHQAKIVGYDSWSDLAILKIDAKDLKPVTFGDSGEINVGDDVIAIGSPGGEKFQNSLTKGIVSAVDRELSVNKYVRYIQSDAAISPGSSGGPLCNIYGQVIGITTAKTVAKNYENMSFSIPSATVEEIVGDLMRYGYVQGRTRIGMTGAEVSAEEIYYTNTPAGVIINEIDESGSLAGTDIKKGDIITELDGKTITSFQDIYDVLADHKEGDKISIKVQRPSN